MAVKVVAKKNTAFDLPGVSDGVVKFLENKEVAMSEEHGLYEHQIDAVLTTRQYLKRNPPSRPAIIVLPTGCGKTGVAVLASYALNVHRVLIITPSATISEQIREDFIGVTSKGKHVGTFMVNRGIFEKEELELVPSCTLIKKVCEIPGHKQNDLLIVNAHKLTEEILQDIPSDHYDLVIVDEAHHYPAKTWKIPVEYFSSSKKIFLTATPKDGCGGDPVSPICFELDKETAIERGIIRRLIFKEELVLHQWDKVYEDMCQRISEQLDEHDKKKKNKPYQAMVLVYTKAEARLFAEKYIEIYGENSAKAYCGSVKPYIVDDFKKGKIRVLVVAGKLLEGFDHKQVSVVAIARNVQKESRVLFAQFVGRAVRKAYPDENIDAVLISHPVYNQQENYDQFYLITDVEIEPEDDEEP